VRVIDADLGISAGGEAGAGREGFRELVAEVALGAVGLILGVEASRLARDNAAWYQLLDLCTLTGTLIADSDGIYDPADYSDRLVLGLKGTISEAELHLIKGRLIQGLRHKAAKGELRIALPAGYDYAPDGSVMMSADESVREAVRAVFRCFFELCSVRQTVLALRDDGLLLPRRRGPGRVEWVPAAYTAVHDLLVNPTYAGAFAYGRCQSQRRIGEDGRARVVLAAMPRERWRTLILDHHEGYISWEQHEQIRAQIASNASIKSGSGPAREGQALLQGLVRCGRRMHSAYSGARSRQGYARRYYCDPREGEVARNGASPECQGLGGRQLDEAVLAEVFRVLEPAALAATAKALADQEANEAARLKAFETAVERARYEAERARRQFDACEPENRLVARTLERGWEERLRERACAFFCVSVGG
jgi:DNA invertase Pin-like site-specific DNA recombinase